MAKYDVTEFYINFSDHSNLDTTEKQELESIQSNYRPLERLDHLSDYKLSGKITDDEYEMMTGIPYNFG